MNASRLWAVLDFHMVTIALLAVVAVSLLQGVRKGASDSARQLAHDLFRAAAAAVAVILSIAAASALSPRLQQWLTAFGMAKPSPDAGHGRQFADMLLSGIRDMPLLRFAVLSLLLYGIIRAVIGFAVRPVAAVVSAPLALLPSGGLLSRAAGGLIGAVTGAVRALLLTALLFAYCSLFPGEPYAGLIQQSGLYREAAAHVIRPAAGPLLESRLPVFAQALTEELEALWLRRYDVIDADVPDDIVAAARTITEGKDGGEAKARALYEWVGTRISYDHDKARAYEERGEWREQSPEDTFRTRTGVCIDYARLYAAMARAAGLEARVVTGLGYDGRGGYGAHAWNEVYLSETGRWVPLDPTWARTGDWFDPPNFADTHIRRA